MAESQQAHVSSDNQPVEKRSDYAGNQPKTLPVNQLPFEKEISEDRSRTPSVQENDPEQAVQPTTFGSKPPDGGLAAWSVILGVWCCSFCSYGWMNSIGIFQEYYQDHLLLGYSASTISWIPSLEVFLMTAMGPLVGLVYDRYGPRWLLLVGSVLHVFGLMMASLGTKYYQLLLAQGVCSALGVSMIFQPCRFMNLQPVTCNVLTVPQLSLQQAGGSIRIEVRLLGSLSQVPVWEVSYFRS
jgi:hypothetical protein